MIPVWAGSINTWECDEMGHMNVRFYVEKAMEGLSVLAHHLEMPHAFRTHTSATLIPTDQHIRFIREVRPGKPLTMKACVLEIGESDALIYQELRHGSGELSAALRTRISHAQHASGAPFPWSARTRRALETLKGTPPEESAPRSIDPSNPCLPAEKAVAAYADAASVPVIGRGAVQPHHCDLAGRMRTEWFLGRVSDSVPNLLHDWRQRVATKDGDRPMGGAVLEYRLIYRAWPRAGDLFHVRSSLARVEEKFHSLIHWMLDPVTGHAWMTSEAVAVTFDLDTRKIIPTLPSEMQALRKLAPEGLRI